MGSRPLIWVTPAGVQTIDSSAAPANVGAKAAGLLWLPSAWVPPFFVLSPDFHSLFIDTASTERDQRILSLSPLITEAIRLAGLDSAELLYLRSNAIRETIAERGRYRSLICERALCPVKLSEFFEEASHVDTTAHIGVVVQQYIKPLLSGHLSNARRVAEEYRDGVVEVVNDASGAMAEERVSFRRWRRSKGASTDALACPGPDDLLPVLREPLAFAALATKRVHYEWLWDGRFVYVVQADQEPERQSGASPESFVPPAPSSTAPIVLRLFRQAEHADAATSGKLRNHFRYADDGFAQPPIYVLREPEVLSHVLSGSVDHVLLSDLEALTAHPLVIRTSAASGGATLLPRSDVLHSASEASTWLTGPFAEEIKRRGITADSLMLIAHHFIPALAAAFSTGSPDKREVYIEALWGIPEGLYYYPCDAYLVDTLSPDASDLPERQKGNYEIWEERRFKGEFVAPNAEGRFVVSTTLRPWDWRSTISDKAVLRDIAHYTRKTAAREGQRIKMMWFLQCAPWTGLPPTLPWFHDNEADDWKTAGSSYQRNSRDEMIALRTREDLREVETKAATDYKPKSGRRLVIRVKPSRASDHPR